MPRKKKTIGPAPEQFELFGDLPIPETPKKAAQPAKAPVAEKQSSLAAVSENEAKEEVLVSEVDEKWEDANERAPGEEFFAFSRAVFGVDDSEVHTEIRKDGGLTISVPIECLMPQAPAAERRTNDEALALKQRLLRIYQNGASYKTAAANLGISRDRAKYWKHQFLIGRLQEEIESGAPVRRRYTKEQKEVCLARLAEGATIGELEKEFQIPRLTIRRWRETARARVDGD